MVVGVGAGAGFIEEYSGRQQGWVSSVVGDFIRWTKRHSGGVGCARCIDHVSRYPLSVRALLDRCSIVAEGVTAGLELQMALRGGTRWRHKVAAQGGGTKSLFRTAPIREVVQIPVGLEKSAVGRNYYYCRHLAAMTCARPRRPPSL